MSGPYSSDIQVFFDNLVTNKDNSSELEEGAMSSSVLPKNLNQEQLYNINEIIDGPKFHAPGYDAHNSLPVAASHNNKLKNEPYPVSAFPPIMRNVICTLHEDTLIPVEIIGSAVLAASSLACQAHIDVISPRDVGHREPCAVFLLVLAERGKGKSPIYRKVMRPFYHFVEQTNLDYQEKKAIYDSKYEDWKERDDALKSLRKQAIKKGEDGESENKRRAKFKKPVAPRKFSIIFESSTLKDMIEKLQQYPYAGVFSDEAGSFFKGYLKRNLEFLDKIWSGDSYSHSRPGEPSLNIKAWVSMLLMVQPNIFRRFLENESNDALDIGFVDRLLISITSSDESNSDNDDYCKSDAALDVFHKTILRLLTEQKSNFDSATENKKTLSISSSANEIRKEKSKEITSKPRIKKEWKYMGGFVQKAESNAIRIAAILTHMKNSESTVINEAEISSAYEIVKWHLKQANEFIYLMSEKEQFKEDVRKVFLWLKDMFYKSNLAPILFNDLRQRAPYSLRNSNKLRLIFNQLVCQDIIVLAHVHQNGALYTLPVLRIKSVHYEAPGIYSYKTESGECRLVTRLHDFEDKYISLRAKPFIRDPQENDVFAIFMTSKNTQSESAEVDLSDILSVE